MKLQEQWCEIVIVEGMPCWWKTSFLIEELGKTVAKIIDSKKITETLYESWPWEKYKAFQSLVERNKKLKKGDYIDRDIIWVLAYFVYYLDEEFKKKHNEKNTERCFGENDKNTDFYEKNYQENFEIITNRNVLKQTIQNHLKYFPKDISKILYYFRADKNTIRKRLRSRSENSNSWTKNEHYKNLLDDDKYFDRYNYSMELVFLLFKEVIKEFYIKDWQIKEKDTSENF
jgi:hypothetical protein